MHEPGTALVDDIKPKSPVDRLSINLGRLSAEDLAHKVDIGLASAVLGMSNAFIARAMGRPGGQPRTLTIEQIIDLLDVDGYQETFVRRSQVPRYLLEQATAPAGAEPMIDGRAQTMPEVFLGNARDLIRGLAPGSVQAIVTSTPYWGMRIYENTRPVKWADGEHCVFGFEQTPEGFIRHTVEILYLLRPALAADGSVWWNISDTYNTRTPIRGNARERLDAMGGVAESRRGWTEHEACRHSAGHIFLTDAEQCSIPPRIAERASRIGYRLISYITWRKHTSSPESARNRVTRQAEYILCLSPSPKAPRFHKEQWKELEAHVGGPNPQFESRDRITDVWTLPVAQGKNGHGAEYPLALPARCIALSSQKGDVILDPFLGSGTTAMAARQLGRRCLGFDISEHYVNIARARLDATSDQGSAENEEQFTLPDAQGEPRRRAVPGDDSAPASVDPTPRVGRSDRKRANLIAAAPSTI